VTYKISLSASHFIAKKERWSIASQMPSRSPFRRTALRIRHAVDRPCARRWPCPVARPSKGR
jgi:hypothetical protein